jgi:Skp family chaperone for outer membrane proteins
MRFEKAGWPIAGALAVALVAGGFQGAAEKYGVVDIAKVFNDSDFSKRQTESLRAVGEARSAILTFADTYKTFTTEQATRFRDLSLKPNPTESEKAELERIKRDVMAAEKTLGDLSQKPSPTPAEVTQLNELNRRKQNMNVLLRRWAQEFEEEIGSMREKLRDEALAKVKDSVREAGKAGAYTLIFANDIAPYGANDVTPEAVKAVNRK